MRRLPLILLALAASLISLQTTSQGPSKIDSLKNLLRGRAEDSITVNILNNLAWALRLKGEFSSADSFAKKALDLSNKLDYKIGQATAFRTLGSVNETQGNFSEATGFYNKGLSIATSNNLKLAAANCYNGLGNVNAFQGNYSEALRYHLTSLKLKIEIKDIRGMASSYGNIANVYDFQGRYSESLRYKLTSLKLYEQLGDQFGISALLGNIGNIYYYLKKYPEAIQYYQSALKIHQKMGNVKGEGDIYTNMGGVYSGLGDNKRSAESYRKALLIFKEIDNKPGIATCLSNLGSLSSDNKQYKEALTYLNPALAIYKETGSMKEYAACNTDLGKIYVNLAGTTSGNMGNEYLLQAREYLTEALSVAKQVGAKEVLRNTYEGLADLEQAQGDYRKALENFKESVKYKDSLVNEESLRQIASLKLQYETEKKDREISMLAKENSFKNQQLDVLTLKNKQQVALVLILFAGAIILLIVTLIIVKSRKRISKTFLLVKKQKGEIAQAMNEIKAMNDELEAFAYSISHDLRAPVRRIEGLGKILMEDYSGLLDEEGKNIVRMLDDTSLTMNMLIEDLLKLSKITRTTVQRASCDVTLRAGDICNILKKQYAGQEVNCIIQEGMTVNADPQLLNIALQNLLENAFKYTSRSEAPEVIIRSETRDEKTIILISDNGAGFSMSQAGKLFIPFQRLHTEEEFKGTGIGLAIVKRIVTKHGGTIGAESEPGKGTTFFLSFE
jgi:signal transduction histidine kinase/Tfp pilus assembly protein PilF